MMLCPLVGTLKSAALYTNIPVDCLGGTAYVLGMNENSKEKKLCIVDNPNLVINIWCLICHKTIGAVQIEIQIIHQNQKTVM